MKKIITLLFISISFLLINVNLWFAECKYSESWDISSNLDTCLSDSTLVNAWGAKVWDQFDKYILWWITNIGLYLWFFAVLSIVIWSLMLTLSSWDDEKINKAKGVVKWGIIWFIWVITASALISILVKIIYSI